MIGVRLRSYRFTDVDPIVAWAADPETTRWMGPRWKNGRTRDQIAEAVERIVAGGAEGVYYVITDDTGAYLGAVDLTSVDQGAGTAVVSLVVVPECRGRGVGTGALEALGHRAVALGLSRLLLRVEPENGAALRCYQKAGFRETGWDEGLRTMERDLRDLTGKL
jgi:RimJ/RimL family protein N-acetyltransferase